MDLSTILLSVLVLILIGIIIFLLLTNPSLSREWSPDQAVMPEVEFLDNDHVRIRNIRNIRYRTTRDYDLDYYDRIIDPTTLDSAWLAISPFAHFGIAHAFLSFGFNDGTYLAVSIEIRRKRGKSFDPLKAFMRQFEIMYVLADERDVIGVRTNCIGYTVRLFPIQSEPHRMQAVFLDILKRADKLGREPEFYNTIWNNCTTNIIGHTRRFSEKPIPVWSYRYLLPESLDKIAYRLAMIDTHLPFEAAREHFDITKAAQAAGDAEDFSRAIRAHIKRRPVES